MTSKKKDISFLFLNQSLPYSSMDWSNVEKAFSRSLFFSFSKKKLLLTFPVLVLFGILTLFCRALAFDASPWISLSLFFLPFLISSALFLALGALLARIHEYEMKALPLNIRPWISGSFDFMVGTAYLALPPIFFYFVLWIVLGIFFLLQAIPGIGDFFRVIFSFVPFLLILASLVLCLFNLGLLFYLAPIAGLHSMEKISLAKRVLQIFRTKPLSALVLFLIALLPIVLMTAIVAEALMLTDLSFSHPTSILFVTMQHLFLMLPLAAIGTPAVVFFFNFAAESQTLLQNRS